MRNFSVPPLLLVLQKLESSNKQTVTFAIASVLDFGVVVSWLGLAMAGQGGHGRRWLKVGSL